MKQILFNNSKLVLLSSRPKAGGTSLKDLWFRGKIISSRTYRHQFNSDKILYKIIKLLSYGSHNKREYVLCDIFDKDVLGKLT